MADPSESSLELTELRNIRNLLTHIHLDGKNQNEKLGFLEKLGLTAPEMTEFVDMSVDAIRKALQRSRKNKGK